MFAIEAEGLVAGRIVMEGPLDALTAGAGAWSTRCWPGTSSLGGDGPLVDAGRRVSLAGATMADQEVLPYRAFRKTEDAPILYWMAYRRGERGGYAGTSVVPALLPVFTAPTEERLKEIASELGYDLQRDDIP